MHARLHVRPHAVLAVVAAVVVLVGAGPSRPRYIECVDSSECGAWECCVLGGGRYSLPRCAALPDVGEPCRPTAGYGSGTVNRTVSYPDGAVVHLPAVFLYTCPCSPGLACDRQDTVCAGPAGHELNAL